MERLQWRPWPPENGDPLPARPGVLVLGDQSRRILYIAATADLRATTLTNSHWLPRGAREAAAVLHWEEAPDPEARRARLVEEYAAANGDAYPPFNRRYPRYPARHPASCGVPKGSSVLHLPGESTDFSQGGLGVLLPAPIPSQTPVTVQLQLPSGPLEALGLVLWSAQEGERTRVGIEIYTPLGLGGRVRWARHLESLATSA